MYIRRGLALLSPDTKEPMNNSSCGNLSFSLPTTPLHVDPPGLQPTELVGKEFPEDNRANRPLPSVEPWFP